MILRVVNLRTPTAERGQKPKQGFYVNAGILRNPTSTITQDGDTTSVTQAVIEGPGVTRWIQLLYGSIASKLVQVHPHLFNICLDRAKTDHNLEYFPPIHGKSNPVFAFFCIWGFCLFAYS